MAWEFIAQNRAGALATNDAAHLPHIALVYVVVHHDLSIYFTTRAEGRKYENLMRDPQVAMMFAGANSLQQLQLTGHVEQVTDLEAELDILHELMKLRYADKSLPRPQVNLLEPGVRKEYVIFKVTGDEMTYSDFETSQVGKYKPEFIKIM
ncbi:MAG TPA: pyridoxamine 5'-phosphate oxidase family protein [Candidatus Saccharimonadales bacterium]|nr:pyridoxamine 5'-phosphate oxidase family protein [Candidatus Saccharimonadales bacterium]